jgi:hypothetical protein
MDEREGNAADAADAMDALLSARALLERVTPLKSACGRLCGAACCQGDASEDGARAPENGAGASKGMYLFPLEERLYGSDDGWARLLRSEWKVKDRRVPLLVCEGVCPREARPLACRFFPLAARVEGNGVVPRLDPRGWPVCPLMPHGARGLDPAFVDAAGAAFKLLWASPPHRAFLRALDTLLTQHERPFGDKQNE